MWLRQLLQALSLLNDLAIQLATLNSTPVGQTADVTIPGNHPLEVSESGEHWTLVSSTWKRVK